MDGEADLSSRQIDSFATWAIVTGVLGVLALVMVFWLVLPSFLLGAAAVVLGVLARRRTRDHPRSRDVATVAITLGVVAMLFTPVIIGHTGAAEDWGRDCALHPEQDENCPAP